MAMPRGGRPLVMANLMPACTQTGDGLNGAFGEDFFLRHQSAVDVSDYQVDAIGHVGHEFWALELTALFFSSDAA